MKLEHVFCSNLLLLMIVLLCAKSGAIRPITCTAGTFSPGQPAAVTCNLHANLSATELGFNVVRYHPAASKHDLGKNILLCEWKSQKRKHDCTVQDGYTFNNSSHDSLTINIPTVTEESAGLYNCYFVPPKDKQESHPCELIVKEVSRGTTALPQKTTTNTIHLPKEKDEQSLVWVIVIVLLILIFVVSFAAIGLYMFIKRRRSKKQKKERRDEDTGQRLRLISACTDPEQFLGVGEAFVQQTWDGLDTPMKESLKGLVMHNDLCKEVMLVLKSELDAARSKGPSATTNMFSTLVRYLPTGQEKGDFVVLNLGSRTLRILFVKLKGQDINTHVSVTYKIPQDVRLGTCTQLLNFIANRVSMFVTSKQQELGGGEHFVAVVFSFPCKHTTEDDLITAQLTKWTKGFTCKEVLDTDFGKRLHQQLQNKPTTQHLTIKVIINDAVGLLMAGVHKDKACMISFVLGKGVNGCYINDNGSEGTAERCNTAKMIIATEWGALGEDKRLDKFRTEFDQTAITFSMSPTQQILEKMVGMLYIGEIVREVLLKLVKEGYLFKRFYSDLPALNEKRGFPTEHVMKIDSDVDKDSLVTKDLLQALEFDPISDDDCKLVKFVCRIVLRRAAYLAAAALASMVKHVHHHQHDITVAIDGSLWRAHPRFKEEMKAQAKIFAGPDVNVKFESILDGSEIGAALTTAVSLSRKLSFRDK